MSALVYRINLGRNLPVIKKGQVLYYLGEDFKDIEGALVSEGFYEAETISILKNSKLIRTNKSKFPVTYRLSLNRIAWDPMKIDWVKTYNSCLVEASVEDLHVNFGIHNLSSREAKSKLYVKELIKHTFDKANRSEDFDDTIDYDKIFQGIAGKLFRKNPFQINPADQDDMILDALNQVVTPVTVKQYDTSRDPVGYFGGMFQLRLIDQLKAYTTRKVKEKQQQTAPDDDFTQEEKLEYQRQKQQEGPESPETQLHYKQLLQDITKYLHSKPDGKYLVPMFGGLQKGYSSSEMASKMGVSPGFIAQKLSKLRDYILEYSKETDNDLLYNLMLQYSKTKKHNLQLPEGHESHEGDDWSHFVKVLELYHKKVGGETDEDTFTHKPVGEIMKIQKIEFPIKSEEDFISSRILSDTTTQEDLQDELTAYFDELNSMDELLEDEDSIVGLRVLGAETRSVQAYKDRTALAEELAEFCQNNDLATPKVTTGENKNKHYQYVSFARGDALKGVIYIHHQGRLYVKFNQTISSKLPETGYFAFSNPTRVKKFLNAAFNKTDFETAISYARNRKAIE